ncbi:hypothetical protein ACYCFK_11615 [Stutzerimonas stutzeri]
MQAFFIGREVEGLRPLAADCRRRLRQAIAQTLQLSLGNHRALLGKLHLGPAGTVYLAALMTAELQALATTLHIQRLADLASGNELPLCAQPELLTRNNLHRSSPATDIISASVSKS